jgi:hypothetical protein
LFVVIWFILFIFLYKRILFVFSLPFQQHFILETNGKRI